MTPDRTVTFRRARATEAPELLMLERAANLVALAHVFPPDRHPFPDDDVRDRWSRLLSEGDVTVEVVDGRDGLVCLVAYDATRLRHLAVHPDDWGAGLARAAVTRAVAAIRAGGGTPLLWCLLDNHRARGLYEHLGWQPTGRTRSAEFPPYPIEVEHALRGSGRG